MTPRKRRAAQRLALFFFAAFLGAQSEELAREMERARQFMQAGKYEQAIPIYERAVKEVPGNPGLVLNLGLAEHMAGHEREAIAHLETVLKTRPNFVPALT